MILNHRIIGKGPLLFILHGLFGSLDNWMSIAKNLSVQFTVCLVDLRNHGLSFHDHEFNYQAMAKDLKFLVEKLNVENYSIMGHSMGGKVAMFHVAQNQQLVRNLVVVDIGPKNYPVHHQQILDGLLSIDPGKLTNRSQADELLIPFIPQPGVRQFLLKNLKRTVDGAFSWKMNLPMIAEQIDSVGTALPANTVIKNQTLFIRGGSSNYIMEDDFSAISHQFPMSRVATISGVGHWVHAEAPEEFLVLVRDFLNQA